MIGVIDLVLNRTGIPAIALSLGGTDLDPWSSLSLDDQSDLSVSRVNIAGKLDTTGSSTRELANNAQGRFRMDARNGSVSTDILRLLFVDLIGWATHRTTGQDKEILECGVLDLHFKDGKITSQGLFVETKSFSVTGQARTDLTNETIDAVFLPRKRATFFKSETPVKIEGPLGRPAVTTVPWKSATRAYGELAFAPVFVGLGITRKLTDSFRKDQLSACAEYAAQMSNSNQTDR